MNSGAASMQIYKTFNSARLAELKVFVRSQTTYRHKAYQIRAALIPTNVDVAL